LLLGNEFARAVGKHDRRLAGIDRRRQPGVQPRCGAGHCRLERESRLDAVIGLVAIGEIGGCQQQQQQGPQSERVAHIDARMRPA
jgi:hypothetical protein